MKKIILVGFLSFLLLGSNISSFVTPKIPSNALSLPMIRQKQNYSCGPAALLSVFYYWQVFQGLEKDLYEPLKTDPEQGTEGIKMAEVARMFGLGATVSSDVTFSELRYFLDMQKTVILEIQAWPFKNYGNTPWRDIWDEGHFVVLIGMDDHYAYFMDTAIEEIGYVYVPLEELNERWHNVAQGLDGISRPYQHFVIIISGKNPLQSYIPPRTPLIRLE